MDFICELCNKYDVPLVEDISQNIGSKYKGKLLGKFGFASFYSASLTKYVDGYNGAFVLLNSKVILNKVSEFLVMEIQLILIRLLVSLSATAKSGC